MGALLTEMTTFGTHVWAKGRELTRDDFEIGSWSVTLANDWFVSHNILPNLVTASVNIGPTLALLTELRSITTEEELGEIILFFMNYNIRRWPDMKRDTSVDERAIWLPSFVERLKYTGRRTLESKKKHYATRCEAMAKKIDVEGEAEIDRQITILNDSWQRVLEQRREDYRQKVIAACTDLGTYEQDVLSKESGTVSKEVKLAELIIQVENLKREIDVIKYNRLRADFKFADENWIAEIPTEVSVEITKRLAEKAIAPPPSKFVPRRLSASIERSSL